MKAILVLLLLAALAVGGYWYVKEHRSQTEKAKSDISEMADKASDTVKKQFDKYSVHAKDLKKELEETGKVVRERTREAGAAIADATADTRAKAAIKAKLVADPDLSAWKISVDVTEGTATLAGTAPSYDAIGKAISLAMETDGVHKVVSTLQVKK